MRFNEDNIDKLLEKYELEAKEEFISEVKKLYFENALEEYKSYNTFDEELLKDLFLQSVFMSLVNDDLNYVLDKYPEYWANHIIKEINNTVDFYALRKLENEKFIYEPLDTLGISDLIEENIDKLNISIQEYLEPKYVKRKKEFLTTNGIISYPEPSMLKFFKKIIEFTYIKDFRKNSLPSSILAKEITMNTAIDNDYYDNLYNPDLEFNKVAY